MHQVDGSVIRERWVALVEAQGPSTSEDLLRALRSDGLLPKGEDYKGWIRNIHSAAVRDPRLIKTKPGTFGLAGKDEA
ncbi:hypothetical protein GCM10009826_29320 [Humibacillus xanthopallidus]